MTKAETEKSKCEDCILQAHVTPSYVEFNFNSAVDHTSVAFLIIILRILIYPHFHTKLNLELVLFAVQVNVTTVRDIKGKLLLVYSFGEGISTKLYNTQ